MNEIEYGNKWDMTFADNDEEAKKLLEDGWEPYSVRKGDFVISGMSLGWLFASPVYYFKRPHQKL